MYRLLNVNGRAALERDGHWHDLAQVSGDTSRPIRWWPSLGPPSFMTCRDGARRRRSVGSWLT